MNGNTVSEKTKMVRILVEAPFATFRTFSAGSFRPTAGFMTPSAAYGLVMNLAGVNTRHDDGRSAMTLMRDDLPTVRIALGIPTSPNHELELPMPQSVFQQLHNYPVGNSGKDHAPNTKGNKYNITPVRRQFLMDLRAVIALECHSEILETIRRSLKGAPTSDRFGLPFLGDNSFLPDRVEEVDSTAPAFWFEKIGPDNHGDELRAGVTRLTQWIDRADMSRTRSALYAPNDTASVNPSEIAWTEVGPTTDN
jgi:CRISPR-associated protein Cas5t